MPVLAVAQSQTVVAAADTHLTVRTVYLDFFQFQLHFALRAQILFLIVRTVILDPRLFDAVNVLLDFM